PGHERPVIISTIIDFRECSKQRWYPARSLVVLNAEAKAPELPRVREFLVVELDADTPPKDDEFQTTIPAGWQVKNPGKGSGFGLYREAKDNVVFAHDLDRIASKLKMAKEMADARRGERAAERGRRLPAVFWVFLGVACALFLLLALRRWRGK